MSVSYERFVNDETWLSVGLTRSLEKGTFVCGNVGESYNYGIKY